MQIRTISHIVAIICQDKIITILYMNISLIYPCFLYLVITIYLYIITSKTNDKTILSVMIFGQLLLLIGSTIKNNILIAFFITFYQVETRQEFAFHFV